MTETDLTARIARLEAIEAIKSLKHRYLRACDAKDPETFRDCFVREGASIDYGPQIGTFEGADGLAEVFRRVALQRVEGEYIILDMHHGMHPEIELLDAAHARGFWTLRFRQVDRSARTEQVSAIEYDDRYKLEEDRWRIHSCHVRVLWSMQQPLPEGTTISASLPSH